MNYYRIFSYPQAKSYKRINEWLKEKDVEFFYSQWGKSTDNRIYKISPAEATKLPHNKHQLPQITDYETYWEMYDMKDSEFENDYRFPCKWISGHETDNPGKEPDEIIQEQIRDKKRKSIRHDFW